MAKTTPAKIRIVYCDSCFFIAVFNRKNNRVETCSKIINDAKAKRIQMVTSFLTVAECSQIFAGNYPAGNDTDQVAAFLDNDFIEKINVDWFVANTARQIQAKLAREYALKPQDAIHLATAFLEPIDMMFTYDDKLLRLDKHKALQEMCVCQPNCTWDKLVAPRTGMFAGETNDESEDENDGFSQRAIKI